MGFKLIEPGQITAKFPYVNSAAGIRPEDGLVLIMRPLTLDELEEFDAQAGAIYKIKSNPNKGKGFRDRGADPRADVSMTSDPETVRKVKRARIQESLVGWEGFEDADGRPVPFSFDNFMRFCQILPDLFQFANEKVDEASTEAIGKLRGLQESEKN